MSRGFMGYCPTTTHQFACPNSEVMSRNLGIGYDIGSSINKQTPSNSYNSNSTFVSSFQSAPYKTREDQERMDNIYKNGGPYTAHLQHLTSFK